MSFPQRFMIRVLCTALLLCALPIGAQSVESALARSRYSEAQKDTIIHLFTQAEDSGIPAGLLLPKLEEGIAKGVPASRMVQALRRELQHLEQARALLLQSSAEKYWLSDTAFWARTANLVAVGVSDGEIERLIELCTRHPEGYRPATYLYVAIQDWGLDREPAFDLIGSLLASSIPPDSYMGVLDLLAGGRRRRIPPEELVQRIRENLEHVTSIKDLEKWIY
jgi:hypothetical protein